MALNKSDIDALAESLSPMSMLESELSDKNSFPWSTPLEFFESDRFCGLHLYPNQRLMLKLWNLQYEDLTDYENMTIDKWCKSFKNDKYKVGIVPDIRERMSILKKQGYTHFTTIVPILGRRASKSFMSGSQIALNDAEMLWRGIPSMSFNSSLADKQDNAVGGSDFWKQDEQEEDDNSFDSIDKDTSVYSIVMATTASQAQETIFKDYYNAVLSNKWLQQYVLRITPFQIVYQTLNDKLKTLQYLKEGVPIERELSSMVSKPISSNSNAIRGRAVKSFISDEIFFATAGDSFRSGDRMLAAITPATQTFGKSKLIMLPSSPWTRTGRAYNIYLQGQVLVDEYLEAAGMKVTAKNRQQLEEDVDKGKEAVIADPTIFVAQLESWRLYEEYQSEAFVPTYYSGWSPKKLTLQNENGDVIVKTVMTNAKVGNYVSLDSKERKDS